MGAGDVAANGRERRVTVTLALPPRDSVHGFVRAGGPVLAYGVRYSDVFTSGLEGLKDRGLVRGAWELGLGERGFVSAAIETDFDSVFESIVFDVATPDLMLTVPSLRVGGGLVARELGPRDADLGLRMRVGASVMLVGADLDLDYWPAIDDATLTSTLRVSL